MTTWSGPSLPIPAASIGPINFHVNSIENTRWIPSLNSKREKTETAIQKVGTANIKQEPTEGLNITEPQRPQQQREALAEGHTRRCVYVFRLSFAGKLAV